MALVKCPECGREVAADAPACPSCGAPVAARINADRERQRSKRSGKFVLGLIALIVIIYALSSKRSGSRDPSASATTPALQGTAAAATDSAFGWRIEEGKSSM